MHVYGINRVGQIIWKSANNLEKIYKTNYTFQDNRVIIGFADLDSRTKTIVFIVGDKEVVCETNYIPSNNDIYTACNDSGYFAVLRGHDIKSLIKHTFYSKKLSMVSKLTDDLLKIQNGSDGDKKKFNVFSISKDKFLFDKFCYEIDYDKDDKCLLVRVDTDSSRRTFDLNGECKQDTHDTIYNRNPQHVIGVLINSVPCYIERMSYHLGGYKYFVYKKEDVESNPYPNVWFQCNWFYVAHDYLSNAGVVFSDNYSYFNSRKQHIDFTSNNKVSFIVDDDKVSYFDDNSELVDTDILCARKNWTSPLCVADKNTIYINSERSKQYFNAEQYFVDVQTGKRISPIGIFNTINSLLYDYKHQLVKYTKDGERFIAQYTDGSINTFSIDYSIKKIEQRYWHKSGTSLDEFKTIETTNNNFVLVVEDEDNNVHIYDKNMKEFKQQIKHLNEYYLWHNGHNKIAVSTDIQFTRYAMLYDEITDIKYIKADYTYESERYSFMVSNAYNKKQLYLPKDTHINSIHGELDMIKTGWVDDIQINKADVWYDVFINSSSKLIKNYIEIIDNNTVTPIGTVRDDKNKLTFCQKRKRKRD